VGTPAGVRLMAVVALLPQDGLFLALPQHLSGSGHPVERQLHGKWPFCASCQKLIGQKIVKLLLSLGSQLNLVAGMGKEPPGNCDNAAGQASRGIVAGGPGGFTTARVGRCAVN
jgi:hypothetical protein